MFLFFVGEALLIVSGMSEARIFPEAGALRSRTPDSPPASENVDTYFPHTHLPNNAFLFQTNFFPPFLAHTPAQSPSLKATVLEIYYY